MILWLHDLLCINKLVPSPLSHQFLWIFCSPFLTQSPFRILIFISLAFWKHFYNTKQQGKCPGTVLSRERFVFTPKLRLRACNSPKICVQHVLSAEWGMLSPHCHCAIFHAAVFLLPYSKFPSPGRNIISSHLGSWLACKARGAWGNF